MSPRRVTFRRDMCLKAMAHVMSHPKGLQMLLGMTLYPKLELGIPRSQLGLRWVKVRHISVVNLHARASAKQMMHNDKHGLKSMGRRCRSNLVLALKSDCYCSALVTLHISSVKSVSCYPHMSITVMIIRRLVMIIITATTTIIIITMIIIIKSLVSMHEKIHPWLLAVFAGVRQ